jgi:hypothetical protein
MALEFGALLVFKDRLKIKAFRMNPVTSCTGCGTLRGWWARGIAQAQNAARPNPGYPELVVVVSTDGRSLIRQCYFIQDRFVAAIQSWRGKLMPPILAHTRLLERHMEGMTYNVEGHLSNIEVCLPLCLFVHSKG